MNERPDRHKQATRGDAPLTHTLLPVGRPMDSGGDSVAHADVVSMTLDSLDLAPMTDDMDSGGDSGDVDLLPTLSIDMTRLPWTLDTRGVGVPLLLSPGPGAFTGRESTRRNILPEKMKDENRQSRSAKFRSEKAKIIGVTAIRVSKPLSRRNIMPELTYSQELETLRRRIGVFGDTINTMAIERPLKLHQARRKIQEDRNREAAIEKKLVAKLISDHRALSLPGDGATNSLANGDSDDVLADEIFQACGGNSGQVLSSMDADDEALANSLFEASGGK